MATEKTYSGDENSHPDPITGAPGFHPIGTGVGATGGGLAGAAAGAAIGSVVPGIGTVIGGVVGTIAGAAGGGLAGHAIAENVDPSAEDTYWRENYKTRPYIEQGTDYTEYAPAFRYGWESRANNPDLAYDQAEAHLEKNWRTSEPKPKMEWDKAKYAIKDAWERVAKGGKRTVEKGKEAVPVVEERLNVGKKEVDTGGGVRVNTRVEERPVEAKVNLREENVRVERRSTDRPATEADFAKAGSGTVEVTEHKEVPVINKDARVVEDRQVNRFAGTLHQCAQVRSRLGDDAHLAPHEHAEIEQREPEAIAARLGVMLEECGIDERRRQPVDSALRQRQATREVADADLVLVVRKCPDEPHRVGDRRQPRLRPLAGCSRASAHAIAPVPISGTPV